VLFYAKLVLFYNFIQMLGFSNFWYIVGSIGFYRIILGLHVNFYSFLLLIYPEKIKMSIFWFYFLVYPKESDRKLTSTAVYCYIVIEYSLNTLIMTQTYIFKFKFKNYFILTFNEKKTLWISLSRKIFVWWKRFKNIFI